MRSLVSNGFLAPPTVLILFCLIGGLVSLAWWRTGLTVVLASSVCLFAAATPAFSSWLLKQVEGETPQPNGLDAAHAIVVLSGDFRSGDGINPDGLGPLSLDRVGYACQAYRRLRLPIAVSGGPIAGSRDSVAQLMKHALEQYCGVPVAWSEDLSRTTYENAGNSARLLHAHAVDVVVVVTHAWHMPRAIWSFKRVGLRALPWPAPRTPLKVDKVNDFLPSIEGLQASFYALHELLGGLAYRLLY
jgi:uncharacterized SAM-binding protein YcdF (DUF218 family)